MAAKWLKVVVGLLLLPLCIGTTTTFFKVVQITGRADTVWVALLAGVACWLIIYLLLPKPMWIYVAGHELTHALWVWLLGGKVKKMKVSSKGGYVVITKNNFLIALAPYFFPIYAISVIVTFLIGHLIWGWNQYTAYFHLLLGAAYAFHVTLTWHVLHSRQSDITDHGYLFSITVIWFFNVMILVIGLAAITRAVSVTKALGWCLTETGSVLQRIERIF